MAITTERIGSLGGGLEYVIAGPGSNQSLPAGWREAIIIEPRNTPLAVQGTFRVQESFALLIRIE